MSKTKKFLILCAILTGIGFFLTGLGMAFGGRITGIGLSLDGFEVFTPQNPYGLKNEPPVYEEEELTLDAFHSIVCSVEYADVSILASDHYGIDYRTSERRIPSIEVQDGVLTVKQKMGRSHTGYYGNWYLFNFNIASSGYDEEEHITIYVPKDTALRDISAKNVDYGDMLIENQQADTLVIHDSYGDLTVNAVDAGHMDINMESGELWMSDITAEALSVKNEYGSFDAEGLTVSGATEITMESGELDLYEASGHSLFVRSSYGDLMGEKVNFSTVSLELESGECRIKELTADTLTVESAYGDAAFLLTAPLSDYGLDLDTAYGSIRVNGRERESGSYLAERESPKQIRVSCESGDISVSGSDR